MFFPHLFVRYPLALVGMPWPWEWWPFAEAVAGCGMQLVEAADLNGEDEEAEAEDPFWWWP